MGRPIPQNTPQMAGAVQGEQSRKVVGPGHAPAGAVVLHPVPNNGKDVALHAPTPGGLLALVGQRGFSSTPLVVWNKGFPVVVEVGNPVNIDNILVAAHSFDADFRPLNTYDWLAIRFLHILGARKWS